MDSLEQTAHEVLGRYDLSLKKVQLLKDKGKKALWRVESDRGALVLKKLPGTPARGEFIGAALWHLWQAGVGVPRPFRSKDGSLVLPYGGSAYLLVEELTGRSPEYERLDELAAIMAGLAEFHRGSFGFQPPATCEVQSLLGRWEDVYGKHLERLEAYREQAREDRDDPFSALYLTVADQVIGEVRTCLEGLARAPYQGWVAVSGRNPGLCHQDYAAGNLVLGGDGRVYVFDFDSVTFDLPARDIRKVFNKVMKGRSGGWSGALGWEMLNSYLKVYPLTREQLEVVLLDIRFPHLIVGMVDKYYRRPDAEWAPDKYVKKLESLISVERGKAEAIRELTDWVRER